MNAPQTLTFGRQIGYAAGHMTPTLGDTIAFRSALGISFANPVFLLLLLLGRGGDNPLRVRLTDLVCFLRYDERAVVRP